MATIRVDNEVMQRLKELAIEEGLVFGTPNEVLRKALGIETGRKDTAQVPGFSEGHAGTGAPSSKNPALQHLLDGVLTQLQQLVREHLRFELTQNGRYVLRPDNFVTIKPQERTQDLAFTVYGNPEDFSDLQVSLEIKPDQNSYSRFKVRLDTQIEGALVVIRRAKDLWQNKRRR